MQKQSAFSLDRIGLLTRMRQSRSPQCHHLRCLYAECRGLANAIGVRTWSHHYRGFAEMAVKTANLAVDTNGSVQVGSESGRPESAMLGQSLRNAVCHDLSRPA